MTGPFDYLNGDHLLLDTCSWEARSGNSRDASGNTTETYSAAATLACNVDQPSARWLSVWPDMDVARSVVLWLPASSTAAQRDRITFNSKVYHIIDVRDWRGACLAALCELTDGVSY